MLAAYAQQISASDPLRGLVVGEMQPPRPPEGWAVVDVKAAAVNHHDLWSLRGVGLTDTQLPMILGCDAAGTTDDGSEVIVHSVISSPDWHGDETLDPKRSLLSERHPGTLAERVAVPARNLIPKPPEMSFEEAACLPTAWLTSYRMLFTRGQVTPGMTVLVQGASGGVGSALIRIGAAAGLRMWATARSEDKRAYAASLGASATFEPGQRLPERVDVVMDTIGEPTWSHSVRALKPGGRLVTCGATAGDKPPAELTRIFFLQLSIVGSTMGTVTELQRLVRFCIERNVRPPIHAALPLTEARAGFDALLAGDVRGKIVLLP